MRKMARKETGRCRTMRLLEPNGKGKSRMNVVQNSLSGQRLPVGADDEQKIEKPVFFCLKRSFDAVMSVLLLALLAVPMLLLAACIRLDSPGPAIYKQDRLGKNGVPFMIYKFRTMYTDAEKDGPQWARENDSRCTRLGRVLRLSRIDELPQLVNVLKGEMSFVGPRPERAYFYDLFSTSIDGFDRRLKVIPGITGWAQVNGGYYLLPEEKLRYDMEYIGNMSLKMDLVCILRTVSVIFSHDGAR